MTRFVLPVAAALLGACTLASLPDLWGRFAAGDDPREAAWSAIGGCGAGGGAGSAGAGKWIGRGATGGRYDLQLMQNRTLGGDYIYDATGLDLSTKVLQTYTIGASFSWKANTFELDPYKTGSDAYGTKSQVVGGFGDLGLSASRNFGDMNQHMLGLSLGLPTGRFDIKRTLDNTDPVSPAPWMPPQVQPGTGHYTLGLTMETTIDRDWGLYIFGGNYTAAWSKAAPCGSSTDAVTRFRECQETTPSAWAWNPLDLRHNQDDDYHGAPGTGATQSDVFSLYAHVGYKEETATQSAGASLSIPMAPTYYWEKGATGPGGTVHRSRDVTLKLSYGIEINLDPRNFPIFLAFGVPFVLNPVLDGALPDDPPNYVFTAGIKGTFL